MVKPLINAFLACLILGPMIAQAKAAECDGAITADEALKAEDARYAAQTKSDFGGIRELRKPADGVRRVCPGHPSRHHHNPSHGPPGRPDRKSCRA